MNALRHRNLGKFYITQDAINGHYDRVKEVMGNMVVVEAHYSPTENRYLYVAISNLFDAIEEGRPVPSYNLKFDVNNKLTAMRVDKK